MSGLHVSNNTTATAGRSAAASNNSTRPTDGGMHVVIAHPSEVYRLGMRTIISDLEFAVTVGEAADAQHLRELLRTVSPDVVVLDPTIARHPDEDSCVVRLVRGWAPDVRIVMVTDGPDLIVRRAIEHGVAACLTRTAGGEEFAAALRLVAGGGHFVQADLIGSLMRRTSSTVSAGRLSPRQVRIIRLVCRGYSNTQIASDLGTSVTSVKSHLQLIYAQLDASNRAEAAAIAVRLGVVA